MSDQILINAERAVDFVQRRHNPEQDEGQVTWSEVALADALSDAIQEIRKLRKEVDDLKHGQKQMGWEAME